MLAVFLPVALTSNANAASFDCAKAKSAEEKAVCGDAKLSKLDDEIAENYRAAMAKLSSEGMKILRDGQRQWLKFVRAACVPVRHDGLAFQTCLQRSYETRRDDLRGVFQTIGPFKFINAVRYEFVPVWKDDPTEECGNASQYRGGGYGKSSYPRIDSPKISAAMKWNRLIADIVEHGSTFNENSLESMDSCEDIDIQVDVRGASTDMISALYSLYAYSHGGAHGVQDEHNVNVLLASGALLTATDLFDETKSWEDFLTERATQRVREDLSARKIGGASIKNEVMRSVVQTPERWSLTPQGLEVTFDKYDFDTNPDRPNPVLISWRELKPYLRKPLPFVLPQ